MRERAHRHADGRDAEGVESERHRLQSGRVMAEEHERGATDVVYPDCEATTHAHTTKRLRRVERRVDADGTDKSKGEFDVTTNQCRHDMFSLCA